MKIDLKLFRIRVVDESEIAALICVSYNIDSLKQYVSIEYFELVSSFADYVSSIPSSRMVTFEEELRIFHHAISTYRGGRPEEHNHITKQLKEAYGINIEISIQDITEREEINYE